MEIKVIISGSGLTVPVSSPESITLSGSFDMLTFANPYCTETHFIPGVQKEYIKFITFEGKNLKLVKQSDKCVTFEGEVKIFRYKSEKGIAFKSFAVLPCDITIAEIEYR